MTDEPTPSASAAAPDDVPRDAPISARQGLRIDGADPAALARAVEAIVDYRGDVTLTRRRDGASVAGYVFDGSDGALRLLPADGGAAVRVPLDDIAALEITGRDTAAGKSFETWVRKYVEKRRAESRSR